MRPLGRFAIEGETRASRHLKELEIESGMEGKVVEYGYEREGKYFEGHGEAMEEDGREVEVEKNVALEARRMSTCRGKEAKCLRPHPMLDCRDERMYISDGDNP